MVFHIHLSKSRSHCNNILFPQLANCFHPSFPLLLSPLDSKQKSEFHHFDHATTFPSFFHCIRPKLVVFTTKFEVCLCVKLWASCLHRNRTHLCQASLQWIIHKPALLFKRIKQLLWNAAKCLLVLHWSNLTFTDRN